VESEAIEKSLSFSLADACRAGDCGPKSGSLTIFWSKRICVMSTCHGVCYIHAFVMNVIRLKRKTSAVSQAGTRDRRHRRPSLTRFQGISPNYRTTPPFSNEHPSQSSYKCIHPVRTESAIKPVYDNVGVTAFGYKVEKRMISSLVSFGDIRFYRIVIAEIEWVVIGDRRKRRNCVRVRYNLTNTFSVAIVSQGCCICCAGSHAFGMV
jgi:hypothetical protein